MKILYSVFALMIFLTGCSNIAQPDSEGSYADDLQFDGKYYLNSWEFTIADPSKIKKIGEVEKARRFAKGTNVYEVEGYPDHDVVAVKDEGILPGFSIFVLYEGPDKPSHYPQITYSSVQKFILLFKQQGPHNQFLVDTPSRYSVLFSTDAALGYIYDISDKDGEFGLPMSESKLPKEMADYFNPNLYKCT